MMDISFKVNGKSEQLTVGTSETVAELLRETLHLTGCRIACDGEVCGSCTVLIEGKPAAACSTFAFQLDGRSVETIEGLSSNGHLHKIQQAFLETNAFQCGFCTAGFVLSVKALLDSDPQPSDQKIAEWLKANVCRCTGYRSILAATRLAATRMREE